VANARTNSLHEKLDPELRKQVERDLVEQPPGRETYAKVHEHYRLADRAISVKALERYGGYLRAMARNRWIGELADALENRGRSEDITSTIRSRLLEELVTGDTTIASLLKAAMTEKALTDGQIKAEEWRAKQEAARRAIEASRNEDKDPAQSLERLQGDIEAIYGLTSE